MSKLDSVLRELVDDLLAAMDDATGTWEPCWTRSSSLPHNASTGNAYQGANTIILWAAQLRHTYSSPVWATYKQWAALGGQVRKGEHGTQCIKWIVPTPKDEPDPTKRKGMIPSCFAVFNAAQQDGWVAPETGSVSPGDQFEAWMQMIDHVPATYIDGEPMYIPSLDLVSLPAGWTDAVLGAGVWSHELAHWSGHKDRLARDMSGRFGGEAYAAEELVAEISSAITCNMFGLPTEKRRDSHALYVKHWLSKLDDDPKLLMVAASAAQKATNHLLSYSQEEPCPNPSCPTPSTTSTELLLV